MLAERFRTVWVGPRETAHAGERNIKRLLLFRDPPRLAARAAGGRT